MIEVMFSNLLQELDDIRKNRTPVVRNVIVDEQSILNWQLLIVPVSQQIFFQQCLHDSVKVNMQILIILYMEKQSSLICHAHTFT